MNSNLLTEILYMQKISDFVKNRIKKNYKIDTQFVIKSLPRNTFRSNFKKRRVFCRIDP